MVVSILHRMNDNRSQGNRRLLIWGLVLGTLVAGFWVARHATTPRVDPYFRDDLGSHEAPARVTSAPAPVPPATAPAPSPVALPPETKIEAQPAMASGPTSFKSRDGSITFRVPAPGDPEYADWQLMLQHRAYQTSAGPRIRLPYDPEWRSVVTGRREVGPVSLPFTGGEESIEALAREILKALAAKDVERLHALRVSGSEYAAICWPEFPQSRPYLKIPVEEAWAMHAAKCIGGTEAAMVEYGGRDLELESIAIEGHEEYRNFKLHRGLKLRVRAVASAETLTLAWVKTVAERDGLYKVFTYSE